MGAPDADILAAAIEILRKRIAAGTATFLVKVKAYRGEPANEEADILADKAISDPKVGPGKEWCQRTNRAVFMCQQLCREAGKVTYQDRHSTFENDVRDAIRRGAAENEVQTHEERLKVLQQNTWIDDRKFLKSCVRANFRAEQGNINHPAYGRVTWTAHFMLWQNESRAFLGKYLNDPRVPWRHKRREMTTIAGIIPVANWLANLKIKQRSDVSCRLCKRAREQRGASTENLPEETCGHINSALCDGMATTVTAAHHFI